MNFAVLFDMDGVLVDTNPYHKLAIQQFCTKYGFTLSEEELHQKVYGRTNTDWITNLFGKLTPDELTAYADEKEALFREIYKPYVRPVKGLLEFLEVLETSNIPRAIATSAPRANVDFILAHIPIGKYFNTILDERMVTIGKPNPEIYIKTAKALNMPNNQCIVIEDSISGITAGRDSGSKVIGVTTTHTREELRATDYCIADFTELTMDVLKTIMK